MTLPLRTLIGAASPMSVSVETQPCGSSGWSPTRNERLVAVIVVVLTLLGAR